MALLRLRNLSLALALSLPASALTTAQADTSSLDDILLNATTVDAGLYKTESAELWKTYQNALLQDKPRVDAHKARKIKDGDKTMRFSLTVKGEKPENGYPLYIALHGGGTAPASLNDSQWEQMKTYYLGGVKAGIMVATRGVTDTWNLHFVNESYRLYDYLIENMIAYEGVDPNRVYILGFSAGGDGVYQVTPRMPDRFAAANMSAGHHNWIKFDNLFQTPFLIQMGQNDAAYKRNTVAVENHIELNRLQKLRGGYIHDCYVHYQGSHNSWSDRDPSGRLQKILANPVAWLESKDQSTTSKDTNAIHWLDQYTRNPYPQKLVWDPKTNAPRNVNKAESILKSEEARQTLGEPRSLFYWLDISGAQAIPEKIVIEASYDREENVIDLKSLGTLDAIRVLVNPTMLDFEKPVTIRVEGEKLGEWPLKADRRVMARTLLERGDANYIFSAEFNLQQTSSGWIVNQE